MCTISIAFPFSVHCQGQSLLTYMLKGFPAEDNKHNKHIYNMCLQQQHLFSLCYWQYPGGPVYCTLYVDRSTTTIWVYSRWFLSATGSGSGLGDLPPMSIFLPRQRNQRLRILKLIITAKQLLDTGCDTF